MEGKRLAAMALACSFAASCGGASTTTGASGAATAAAATATSTTTGAPTAAATAAGGNQPKLTDLLASAKIAQYKITYKISVTGGGAESLGGTQTWYFKPPRSRFDFSVSQSGQSFQMSVFSLPEGTFFCQTITGAGATCFSSKGVSSPLDQNLAVTTSRDLIENSAKYGSTFTDTRTIAGTQATCYDVKATAAGTGMQTGTFCYSKDGIPLLQTFAVSGASWSVEATSLSTTVPDSDFTLPAKPIN